MAVGHTADDLFTDTPWQELVTHVHLLGAPVLLCVDNWGHWVTVVGSLGRDQVLIFDPGNYEYNTRRGGIRAWQQRPLLRRWRAARKDAAGGPRYYGLLIT